MKKIKLKAIFSPIMVFISIALSNALFVVLIKILFPSFKILDAVSNVLFDNKYILLLIFLFLSASIGLLFLWGAWKNKIHFKAFTLNIILVAAPIAIGLSNTIFKLSRSFQQIKFIEAQQKFAFLAQSISNAMSPVLIGTGFSLIGTIAAYFFIQKYIIKQNK